MSIIRVAIQKPLALMLAAVFLWAALTGGVCLCRTVAASGQTNACLVSIDVCGAGTAQFAAPGSASIAPVCADSSDYYYPTILFVPPAPAAAVASAEFGDIEKPPQA